MPTEKPSHLSKAVGDAMNSVPKPESGPPTKPKPEAGSSRSTPPKTPALGPVAQRSPNEQSDGVVPKNQELTKSEDLPRDHRADDAPPTTPISDAAVPRSPGRPRSNRIESFNTDSFMRQNKKFIRFKRKLKLSEEKAWTIITSMLCYVAQSQALTPIIDDVELFAEFCYWDDKPEILINALISVNFLTETLEISNWFQNQPHAARKLHDHRYYQKQKDNEDLNGNSGVVREFPQGNSRKLGQYRSESEKKQESKKSDQNRKMPDSEKRPLNVDNLTDVANKSTLKLIDVVNDLAKTFKISTESKDYSTIFLWMKILLENTDGNTVIATKDKLKQRYLEGKMRKPVGYLIETVKEQVQNLPQEQNNDLIANQQPDPTCPKCNHLLVDGACVSCDYVTKTWEKNYKKNHPKEPK